MHLNIIYNFGQATDQIQQQTLFDEVNTLNQRMSELWLKAEEADPNHSSVVRSQYNDDLAREAGMQTKLKLMTLNVFYQDNVEKNSPIDHFCLKITESAPHLGAKRLIDFIEKAGELEKHLIKHRGASYDSEVFKDFYHRSSEAANRAIDSLIREEVKQAFEIGEDKLILLKEKLDTSSFDDPRFQKIFWEALSEALTPSITTIAVGDTVYSRESIENTLQTKASIGLFLRPKSIPLPQGFSYEPKETDRLSLTANTNIDPKVIRETILQRPWVTQIDLTDGNATLYSYTRDQLLAMTENTHCESFTEQLTLKFDNETNTLTLPKAVIQYVFPHLYPIYSTKQTGIKEINKGHFENLIQIAFGAEFDNPATVLHLADFAGSNTVRRRALEQCQEELPNAVKSMFTDQHSEAVDAINTMLRISPETFMEMLMQQIDEELKRAGADANLPNEANSLLGLFKLMKMNEEAASTIQERYPHLKASQENLSNEHAP